MSARLSYRAIGDLRIWRIVETERPEFSVAELFPDVPPEAWHPYKRWLRSESPGAPSPELGLVLSVQSFLIRTRHHTVVVDTCVGDNKHRWRPQWTMTSGGQYLRLLRAAGVRLGDVDYVISTHLHADHVGWHTRWIDGRWEPTFTKAKYLIAGREWSFWRASHAERGVEHIADSVVPVIESGQACLVDNRHAIADEVRFEETPGHTPGHVSIVLESHRRLAVITGDVLHHPVQCAQPDWRPVVDNDPHLAAETRRAFLERYADRDVLVCGTHFPSPSFGRVISAAEGHAFVWDGSG